VSRVVVFVTNSASRTFETISGQFVIASNEAKSDQAIGAVRFDHRSGIAGRKVRVSQQKSGSRFLSARLNICSVGDVRDGGIRSRYLRLRDEDGAETENHHYAQADERLSHKASFRT
jgi:hypothetical protein